MKNLFGLTLEDLEKIVIDEFKEPKFRAKQIFKWLYSSYVKNIDEMTNLSLSLRDKLKSKYYISHLQLEKKFVEKGSNTTKFLLKTEDDILIESVLLTYEAGSTLCVSTQAGCRMGCVFCESGKCGLLRNLTKGEILNEIYLVNEIEDIKVSNIVLMGSGEPLDNYDEVIGFLKLVMDKDTLNMSKRSITLSTCGLKDKIYLLADSGLDINLALSLHAPFHEMRESMMPVEKANNIDDVLQATFYYRFKTGRRITYEYCLIEGKNDTIECINRLYELFKDTDGLINVIGVNDNSKETVNDKYIHIFVNKLRKKGINVTLRRRLGSSINAACGQLRSRYLNKEV
ncbi:MULTISPECIES: 23S rRNA (adenine(2503)-C(2))-methyltransferase RlmN [Anaerofustis]|uniref:23S rRNA (adenine(2503)-C(2))-methyltransferase RlmN n=1 Tax=Anaerofustis TaxID=264995 RepID=UPI001484FDAC|nr:MULTISPECIES: 23S rRNA (adenine(2503)-C(2))-methyltransferase RlmN [Anaerofustis]MCO8193271.1 23S rRNA (adenine(2503)-C(2))-methyltransferase RlmN [Anaerofustis sp. NSJ-163]